MRDRYRLTATGMVAGNNIGTDIFPEENALLFVYHQDGARFRLVRLSAEQEAAMNAESAKWEWPGNAIFGRSKSPSSAQPA